MNRDQYKSWFSSLVSKIKCIYAINSNVPCNQERKVTEYRRVFKIGDTHWVTFNSAVEPKPPSRAFKAYYPEHCWTQPQWFNPEHPFMAFAQTEPFFFGPIFERLAGTPYSFKVKEVRENKWALDRDVRDSWYRLECALTHVYEFFLARSGGTFPHTLDVQAFRQPSRWGYHKEHESEKAARIRVMNSRNAFVPLMALCTYAFATNRSCAPFDQEALIHVLVNEGRVNSEWANELAQSLMLSTTPFRVGVYVDQNALPQNLFYPMITFNVPIWIRITSNVPNPKDHPVFRIDEVDIWRTARRMREADASTSESSQTLVLPETTLALVENHSRVEEGSRQRPGETMEQFFEREARHRNEILEKETAQQRDSRQSRERSALAYICPGRHGAHVFEWRDESGFLKRCRVPRNDVPGVWEDYAQAQKRYNSARNEWDLSREFAPAAVPETMYDDDDDDDEFEVEPLPLDDPSVSIQGSEQASETDLQSQYPPFVATTDTIPNNKLVEFFNLADAVFIKYGFHPDGTHISELSNTPLAQRYTVDVAMKILGEQRDYSVDDETLDKLAYFVWAYATDKPIPVGLRDLDNESRTTLRSYHSELYAVRLVENGLCRITSTDPTSLVELYLPKASMGLEALRQTLYKNMAELASYYVSRGTPVEWRIRGIPSARPILQLPPGKTEGLGFRAVDYVTNYLDYQSYVRRRNMLLRDRAIARAALMHGGIIWRLTVEALSELYRNYRFDFHELMEEDLPIVSLTQEDLGVICGMYRKWTGKCNAYFKRIY